MHKKETNNSPDTIILHTVHVTQTIIRYQLTQKISVHHLTSMVVSKLHHVVKKGVFHYHFARNLLWSVNERILKIG